jgi:hypothetical protein
MTWNKSSGPWCVLITNLIPNYLMIIFLHKSFNYHSRPCILKLNLSPCLARAEWLGLCYTHGVAKVRHMARREKNRKTVPAGGHHDDAWQHIEMTRWIYPLHTNCFLHIEFALEVGSVTLLDLALSSPAMNHKKTFALLCSLGALWIFWNVYMCPR